jgi:hypothetical protein
MTESFLSLATQGRDPHGSFAPLVVRCHHWKPITPARATFIEV